MLNGPPQVVALHPRCLALKCVFLTKAKHPLSNKWTFQHGAPGLRRFRQGALRELFTPYLVDMCQFHLHFGPVGVMHFLPWCIIPSWKMCGVNLFFINLSCSCYFPDI